jgi:hypothetical protein
MGQPTLRKFKNFMLFVDHKTKKVYPSCQETKSGEAACRSKRDDETFAKRFKVDIDKNRTDNGAFSTVVFKK